MAAGAEVAELTDAAGGEIPDEWVERRERGEPLAWICGSVRFAGRRWRVDPGVYVPRPQTEELARRAAALVPPAGRVLDVCCGSGAIAAHVTAEHPGVWSVGVDVDARAVANARGNGVAAVQGDLASALRPDGSWDVVTAVAPYVPTAALGLLPRDVVAHEPRRALDGGPAGTTLTEGVIAAAAGLLRPGGHLVVELGGDQARRLVSVCERAGFGAVEVWCDDEGDPRGLVATR